MEQGMTKFLIQASESIYVSILHTNAQTTSLSVRSVQIFVVCEVRTYDY